MRKKLQIAFQLDWKDKCNEYLMLRLQLSNYVKGKFLPKLWLKPFVTPRKSASYPVLFKDENFLN